MILIIIKIIMFEINTCHEEQKDKSMIRLTGHLQEKKNVSKETIKIISLKEWCLAVGISANQSTKHIKLLSQFTSCLSKYMFSKISSSPNQKNEKNVEM